MAADELGGGMNHDVRTVPDGTKQIGRCKGVVDDQRQTVLVGDFGDGVNIGKLAVGVARRFHVNGLGVVLNGVFHCP